MNQIFKQRQNINYKSLLVVVSFIFLSFNTTFAQTTLENNTYSITTMTVSNDETIVVKQEDSSTNANMNFVLWFMGSKQDPNAKIIPTINTKKQFMTSGSQPNRLLIKAFLKKAVNFECATV